MLAAALTALALGSTPAAAQISGGLGGKAVAMYDLFVAVPHGRWLGSVVVVPGGAPDAPKGFAPYQEHWHWRDGKPPRVPFVMVDSPFDELPQAHPSRWAHYPHDRFWGDAQPMPAVDKPGATYAVYEQDCSNCFAQDTGGDADPVAWFAFSPREQRAWVEAGLDGPDVGTKTLSVPSAGALLFVPEELPDAGSIKVVEAR